MTEVTECGSGTRRRPIGRDYAAAKDAECGIIRQRELNAEVGMGNAEKKDGGGGRLGEREIGRGGRYTKKMDTRQPCIVR
jgi:hypothetical protein